MKDNVIYLQLIEFFSRAFSFVWYFKIDVIQYGRTSATDSTTELQESKTTHMKYVSVIQHTHLQIFWLLHVWIAKCHRIIQSDIL